MARPKACFGGFVGCRGSSIMSLFNQICFCTFLANLSAIFNALFPFILSFSFLLKRRKLELCCVERQTVVYRAVFDAGGCKEH